MKVGPAGLNNSERLALLSDPVALARLHEQVWSEGHAEWLDAWRASVKADPHAPLLPLQPQVPGPTGLIQTPRNSSGGVEALVLQRFNPLLNRRNSLLFRNKDPPRRIGVPASGVGSPHI
jgi:hypothetical protein